MPSILIRGMVILNKGVPEETRPFRDGVPFVEARWEGRIPPCATVLS
jgi:hypothetical protein